MISIHAPARGATDQEPAPAGSDIISIHAPARGATNLLSLLDHFNRYFNPRSREGSDQVFPVLFVKSRQFQSTLPRGERLDPIYKVITGDEFQSTLPRGERRYRNADLPQSLHFNPRSREGSDPLAECKSQRGINFNPRSREGSDGRN